MKSMTRFASLGLPAAHFGHLEVNSRQMRVMSWRWNFNFNFFVEQN
jgi:hypothetical protein